jgi:hypothetical protein
MQFTWNADTIRWYINANDYSGFYKNVAETITPALTGYKSLCDIGCGLGLFDFEVAPLFEKIDCVDINDAALSSIRDRTAKLGISNIFPRHKNCDELTGRWDVIYMSFFGSRELDRFLPHCQKLFAIVSVTSESEMFPIKQRYKKNTVNDSLKYLVSSDIPYKLTYKQFEFGQPFTSLLDARQCVQSYSPDISDAELDEFLHNKLKETGGEVYPFYIPRTKSVGIFELDGAFK